MLQLLQRISGFLFAIFFLTGCDDLVKVNWSPNGRHCAVLSEDSLQIGDDTGVLHAEPTLGSAIFEWLPDSKSGVVVTARTASWPELTKLISANDLKKISTDANYIFLHRNDVKQLDKYTPSADYDWNVYNLYLKNRYGKPYLSSAIYKAYKDTPMNTPPCLYTAQIYDFSVSPAVALTVLLPTAKQITAINISPSGKLVAISEKENIGCKLSVVSVNGLERRVVSRGVSPSICWSTDSRAVFFVSEDNASSNEPLKKGTLKKMMVAGQNGPLLPKPDKAESLACIEYDQDNVLYCLPDGSILFKSQESKFPRLQNDGSLNRSIFALRADDKAIEKLKLSTDIPECDVRAYAVNHGGTKLVASGYKGQVWLMDLQTHTSTTVQSDVGDTKLAPTWRTDDQFTYAIRNKVRSTNGHDIEVVLRSANDSSEQIISKDWSTKDVSFLHDDDKDAHKPKTTKKPSSVTQ
ncbi:MAG: hypothetical protein P4L53_16020 [Candidatus Obscuribacterales bacterium]|nr:hypothetical protein [Candidatus Obscuribacterales bacterium]